MPVTLKIRVTKEILEETKDDRGASINGVKCFGKTCAIAVAVRDIFPSAYVERYCIRPSGRDRGISIVIPNEATRFIGYFDGGDRSELRPFEFEVDIPDSIIEAINIEELRPLLINHPTLELV